MREHCGPCHYFTNKTRWSRKLGEFFRMMPKVKEGRGHVSHSQMPRPRARAVWKDPRVLRAADSHRPAQMLLNPGSSGTTDTACSAAVSLMRLQVQSLSLLWRPTGTTQRQSALFLTKRFPAPSPEARPFEGHKGLSRIKRNSVPTNVSAIQTTSSWLSPLGAAVQSLSALCIWYGAC